MRIIVLNEHCISVAIGRLEEDISDIVVDIVREEEEEFAALKNTANKNDNIIKFFDRSFFPLYFEFNLKSVEGSI